MSFDPILNVSNLDGSNGFAINFGYYEVFTGASVSNAGDLNDDGFDDLIIGSRAFERDRNMASYVVYGGDYNSNSLSLADLNGENGFSLVFSDSFVSSEYDGGNSFAGDRAGDFNGDGIDDAVFSTSTTLRESYIVFGGRDVSSTTLNPGTSGLEPGLNLDYLNEANIFVIRGASGSPLNDRSAPVSYVGDLNDDGLDDVAIGNHVVFGSRDASSAGLNLSDLNGSNGFVINGINISYQYSDFFKPGFSISSAGDVNNDGIDDLIIGVPSTSVNAGSNPGKSYVVFGGQDFSSGSLDLSALNGSNGFVISGINANDRFGYSVSDAGDVNGDGIDDLIVGAPGVGSDDKGAGYVIFGGQDFSGGSLNLSDLNGNNGFVINGRVGTGISVPGAGFSVSGAGDISGDGLDDLIVGSTLSSEAYIVFGSQNFNSGSLNVTDLNGNNGFTLVTDDDRSAFGASVSSAGDVNGDGADDLIVGARLAHVPHLPWEYFTFFRRPGQSYVVYGRFPSDIAPSATEDTFNTDEDAILTGNVLTNDSDPNGDTFSVTRVNGSTANVGDRITLASGALLTLNEDGTFSYDPNDGFEPLDVGEIGSDSFSYTVTDSNGISSLGRVTIAIEGSNDGLFGRLFDFANLDSSNSFIINGASSFASSAGDINNDGVGDAIVGGDGQTYVLFGDRNLADGSFNVSDLNGSNGFAIAGFGSSVSDVGDFNNDGIDDLVITGAASFRSDNNRSYVVFGGQDFSSGSLNVSDLNGSRGLTIDGISNFATNAGDINNDGIDDLIIRKDYQASVVFGGRDLNSSSVNAIGLDGSNGFVIGSGGLDFPEFSNYPYGGHIVSDAGDINGDGIDDLVVGSPYGFPSGTSYVVFGGQNFSSGSFDVNTLNGSNGFVIHPVDEDNFAGWAIDSAGDINGDGFDDLIIGAPVARYYGHYVKGEAYVVFGDQDFTGGSLNLADLNGRNGFVIDGVAYKDRLSPDIYEPLNFSIDVSASNDRLGETVRGVGDVNGDGFDDINISAPGVNQNYVLLGGQSFSSTLNVADLNGANGFITSHAYGSVSNAGDVNGDGLDDLIVAAPGADKSYVVFGRSATPPNTNQPPTDITLSNNTVAENAAGAIAGILAVTDPDSTNFTFAVDDNRFEVVNGELKLKAEVSLDFETQPNTTVNVTATDSSNNSLTESFQIRAIDVNEVPEVALINQVSSLLDSTDTSARVKVADIAISDDALGSNALSLSGADASRFEIVGSIAGSALFLKAGTVLDAATQSQFEVTVAVDDSTVGITPDDTVAFALTVIADNTPPPDTIVPTAALGSISSLSAIANSSSNYSFTVTYADNVAVDVDSLDNNDIRVTGANGFNQLAQRVSVDVNSDGTPRTATYQITAPTGGWQVANSGSYSIALQADQVADTSGNFTPTSTLGNFQVSVTAPPPATDPIRVEAETLSLSGYKVESLSDASGGAMIGTTTTGTATLSFNAAAGLYDVIIGYFDESDGASQVSVSVDGVALDSWSFNRSPGGGTRANARNLVTRTVATSTALTPGDVLQIRGVPNSGEPARVDYIEFIPVGSVVPTPDTTAPTATLSGASNLSALPNSTSNYSFTVTYADNVAVDVDSLDNNDIRVTGANGFNQLAQRVSVDVNSDGTPRTATYQIVAPTGGWQVANSGSYSIALQANQVGDTSGNFIPTSTLGGFQISVVDAPPSTAPIRVEAETLSLSGYQVEQLGAASGGAMIGTTTTGTATLSFNAAAGLYDVVIGYFDESDGVSQVSVSVDGVLLDSWSFNQSPGGGTRANARNLVARTVATSTPLTPGDLLQIQGVANSGEPARVDYIEFIPVEFADTLIGSSTEEVSATSNGSDDFLIAASLTSGGDRTSPVPFGLENVGAIADINVPSMGSNTLGVESNGINDANIFEISNPLAEPMGTTSFFAEITAAN